VAVHVGSHFGSKEVRRAADQAGRVPAGSQVTRLAAPVSTKIRPEAETAVRAWLGAGIWIELADLTPALAAVLHAASIHNPQFYEKHRMRASTWDIPRSLPPPSLSTSLDEAPVRAVWPEARLARSCPVNAARERRGRDGNLPPTLHAVRLLPPGPPTQAAIHRLHSRVRAVVA